MEVVMAEQMKGLDKNPAAPMQQPYGSPSCERMVDRLYEIYEKLSAATDKAALEEEYKELLKAVRDGVKEKTLASQFIMRFSEYFPNLEMATANALFDLCEDEDVAVRKQAVKDLVIVSRRLPNLVPTVADVFAQMLPTKNTGELKAMHTSLNNLLDINPEGTMAGIFAQIQTGELIAKQRSFEFLQSIKYTSLCSGTMNPALEDCIWDESRKLVKVVDTSEQFMVIRDMLTSTSMAKTEVGRRAILKMIEIMLDTKKNFQEAEHDGVGKLLIAVDFVFQFFHEKNNSVPFFKYFCTRVLPMIKHMADTNENDYFAVLRMTLELFLYVGTIDQNEVAICLKSLLDVAESFLHDVPNDPNADGRIPSYSFSFLESLFYLINEMALLYPSLVSQELQAREEFRARVAYLLQAVFPYQAKLRNDLSGLPLKQIKTEDVKILMLRVLANLGSLGKAFYRTTVPYSGKLRLSWKAKTLKHSLSTKPRPPSPRRKVTLIKRDRMEESYRDDKSKRLYQPPNGKYSDGAFRSGRDSSRTYRIRRGTGRGGEGNRAYRYY